MSFIGKLKTIFKKDDRPRLIVYGDIHGCLDALKQLRKKVDPNENDIEVCVGDFITKGKNSIGVIEYLIEHNIKSVLGNHEDKLLRYIEHTSSPKKNPIKLDDDEVSILRLLKKSHLAYLQSLPVFLKFGEVTIVHGGLQNHTNLNELNKKSIQKVLRLRYVDNNGNFIAKGEEDEKSHFWADVYDGNQGFVIHGHRWSKTVHIHENAIGIDTGCVYGNKLSAVVISKKYDYRVVQQECLKNDKI